MSNARVGSRGRVLPRQRSSAHKAAQEIGLKARHRGVQVKACARMKYKLYQAFICRHEDGVAIAYTESDVDFVVAYIVPEETWYVLPVREVLGRRTMLFRPKGYLRPDPHACYREAWHLLREPDGLTFG